MIDIAIQNFRNIREARLVDEKALSIIVGNNESGKSSFVGAVQFACTGTAFGRKMGATVDGLVLRGADKMTVRVCINNIMVTRTRTSGDAIKSVAERFGVSTEILPLLFDSHMNGDGGSKAMRAFLDGAASSAFDPLTHFATDPPIYELVLKARGTGKITTKEIIAYCESMRAGCKIPTPPVMPASNRPTVDELDKARNDLANAQTLERTATAEYTDSTLLGQKLAQLSQYKAALATYEIQRAAAATVDPLKERRQALVMVASINPDTMGTIAHLLQAGGFTEAVAAVLTAATAVTKASASAKETLIQNPVPATMPTPPVLDNEAFKIAIQLGAPDTSTMDAIRFLSADYLREILTASAGTSADSKRKLELESANVKRLDLKYNELTKIVGAWEAYDRSVPLFEENKAMIETQWARWDLGAKTIAKAETEHVNKSGDIFGQLVSDFSAPILQGRKIRVSRDDGIWLGQDRIEDCSESTRWRIEAAIMAAVGVMLKSPLLLLDGADILDPNNKSAVTQFLLTNIVPRFTHTIITTTTGRAIALEEPLPTGLNATKWIIDNGVLRRL